MHLSSTLNTPMMRETSSAHTYAVDHEVHDGFGHEVSDALVDDADVRIHQVADGLHLPLQLRVHGDGVGWAGVLVLHLRTRDNSESPDRHHDLLWVRKV